MIVQNFVKKFLLRRGECETLENSNFLKKGKMVISVKTQNFSRSRMTKRISPLESSLEIYLRRRIFSNSEAVEISHFSTQQMSGAVKRV